ncbi:MAG: B12-binding domain-containing radical SAM protein [Candidatus Goldbacteria bacterium]|nr:B12-binding domain-containing radical SAM protein [Candidatus Goldiibacteriota bacterium]
MKVMISYPPLKGEGAPTLGQNRQFQWFHNPSFIYPMVPASAATLLKVNGYDVIWNDSIAEMHTWKQYEDILIKAKPDIIAMETKTPVVKQHWQIIERIKQILPESKIVLMGDHVTAMPEESMQNSKVDYILTGGDYDFLLLTLVNYINRGEPLEPGIWYRENGDIKNTGNFKLNHDLNSLPFIDRDLTKWKLYGEKFFKYAPYTYTMVGRDCPWAKCTFCSWTTLYPTFRTRTPESLLNEIDMLIKKYGIREIFDDTGTFPRGEWLKKFCQGVIDRGYKLSLMANFRFDYINESIAPLMKKAGFRLLKFGLESANQATLDRLCKGTKVEDIEKGCKIAKDAGIGVHLTIMVGYPWETKDDALRTYEMARKLLDKGLADMLQSTVVIAYPGTPLYNEALANNWLRFKPGEWEKYDMTMPVFNLPDMQPQDVMKICDDIYKAFMTPRFIMRQILSIRTFEDFAFLFKAGKAVIGHILDFQRKKE